MTFSPGTKLGRYEIRSKIGKGGMGEVYRAHDEKLNRDVAIKVLPADVASDPNRMNRFVQEAKAVSALNHPNILTIYEIDNSDAGHFMATEFIDGVTLRHRLRETPFTVMNALDIARQVTEALAAAQQSGIIHRDIKPENVMVRADGLVKVLDFGLAKVTVAAASDPEGETRIQSEPGMIMGTIAYMSPEQARGLAVDQRTDIWSLGVVLYEMITRRLPFVGATVLDVLTGILSREPDLLVHHTPEVPRELQHIISKALRKECGERYQTAKDLLIDLKDLKRDLELQAHLELSSPPELRGRHRSMDSSETATAETVQTQRVPTASGGVAPGIAVLPFANLSADKENEYFSDGLAEEIINALAHMPNLKVAGRTSSFFFRGKDVEFEEIGKRLKVDHILEGSVRRAANRIRITAKLIKVADGFHLWSERYDRQITDIFTIQDEITQAIAEALRVKLSPEGVVPKRYEPNLLAYDAYLKARQQWFKGTAESQTQFKKFVDLAIELDPKFALPYFLLGAQYSMDANLGITPARKVIPLGQAAEQEALRLDPSLPEPHALLACFAGYQYDWDEANRQWQLAMTREPASLSAVKASDIRFWYGNHYLLPVGRPAEAIEAEAIGIQEDPLNLLYRHLFAAALQHAGRLGDAEAELRKILDVDENFSVALGTLGAVCAQQGRVEEALAFTERAHSLRPWENPIVGQLAALLVRTRATTRAEGLIDRLRSSNTYLAPTGLTVFHAMCGEFDRAAEWAEKAIDEQYGPIIRILAPLLRPTPVWPALAKQMNLPSSGGGSTELRWN